MVLVFSSCTRGGRNLIYQKDVLYSNAGTSQIEPASIRILKTSDPLPESRQKADISALNPADTFAYAPHAVQLLMAAKNYEIRQDKTAYSPPSGQLRNEAFFPPVLLDFEGENKEIDENPDIDKNPDTDENSDPIILKPHKKDTEFYARYSKKFGIRFNGSENMRLIKSVDHWLGTPYKWGGCSESGVDCSCLIKHIYEDVYDVQLDRTSLTICQEGDISSFRKETFQEGDILCFKMDNGAISHVGVYLKDNKFVHASQSKGVIISTLDRSFYITRLAVARRVFNTPGIQLAQLNIGELVVVNH
jgi:hypothetical protein